MAQAMFLLSVRAPLCSVQQVSAAQSAPRKPLLAAQRSGEIGGRLFQRALNPQSMTQRASACRPRSYQSQWNPQGKGTDGPWSFSSDDFRRMTSAAETEAASAAARATEAIFSELEDVFDPDRIKSRTSRGRGYQDWRRGGRDSAQNGGAKRQEAPSEQSRGGDMRVAVDTSESDEAYTFLADLPGTKKDNVKVQAKPENGMLSISGQRFAPEVQEGRRRRIERSFGTFTRTFKMRWEIGLRAVQAGFERFLDMPEDADLGKISANFKDGVLAVTVQRTQPAQPEVTEVPIEDWTDAAQWVEEASKAGPDAASEPKAATQSQSDELKFPAAKDDSDNGDDAKW